MGAYAPRMACIITINSDHHHVLGDHAEVEERLVAGLAAGTTSRFPLDNGATLIVTPNFSLTIGDGGSNVGAAYS